MSESRKVAVILVADVVSYSCLAGDDEEGALARLRALRNDLIDPTIAAGHGRPSNAPTTAASSSFAAWSTRYAA